ncbi:EAL domain-containing protein [Shewanella electrodiphila]|uniref:EAL domain-containing protein n=1 Tax=Shewanella electrodiphila TaxID=934143 RepID=A0ABT0KUU6_9GAMM|nr:EAL domain-containing protein [Shewanella electrodiphila]MCL1047602.1 EAL domain-containing protein [Shewanella electrodiphila]
MQMISRLVICTFLLAHALTGLAFADSGTNYDLTLNTEIYNTEDGLSQVTVTSIIEDKDGFVWLGTVNGLNRFDGTNFKHFFAEDGSSNLPSSFIKTLIVDNQNRIIVGTDLGLAMYDDESESFTTIEIDNKPLSEAIWSIAPLSKGIAIGLNNKILILSDNLTRVLWEFNSEVLQEVKKVIEVGNSLFIRNYNGIVFKLEDNKLSTVAYKSNDIGIISNKLFISTNDGLYSIKNNTKEKVSDIVMTYLEPSRSGDELTSIIDSDIVRIDSTNRIKKIGFIEQDASRKRPYIKETKSAIFITDVNLGVIKIDRNRNLIKNSKIIKENIWAITQTDENIFLATDSLDVRVLDKSLKYLYSVTIENASGPKSIKVLNNQLYTGNITGLTKTDLSTLETVQILNRHISNVKISESKDKIYASTINGKVFVIKNSKVINTLTTGERYPIFDLIEKNNELWIASQGGLFKIKDGNTEKIFSESMVTTLKFDENELYFGTRNSLLKLNIKTNELKEIFRHNKLIYSIEIFDNFLVSASAMELNITNKTSFKNLKLTNRNGSQSDYNSLASLHIGDYSLFGGTKGISIVNPNEIYNDILMSGSTNAALIDFSLFNVSEKIGGKILNKPINKQRNITLKYSDYPFTFTFVTPGQPLEEFDFYYQMEGLNDSWLPSQNINSATYTNLSAGIYNFHVYAINKLSGKQSETKSIQITVTPPWYYSFEAKLSYTLLCFIVLFIITKIILRRRQIQKQIALSEERLKLSLWGSGDEMWDWDIETGEIYRSNIWGTLEFPQDGQRSGKPGEESNIHPLDQNRVKTALNDHFKGLTDHFEVAYRVKSRENLWMWILDRAKIVERDQKENPVRMTGTIKNINNLKQTEEQLRLFERAIENISEGMFILDEKYRFVEVNDACCELTNQSREEFIGQLFSFSRYPESYSNQIHASLSQQGCWSNELEANKGDGSHFLMELTVDAIYNQQGETTHYVGVFSDITRRKQQEEELRKLTNSDILTGLPNRSSLQVTLNNLVKKDIHHTLMVLDLDNFKRINDSLGHQIGDELLVDVAKRIQNNVPKHVSLYRLGGDEFAILVDHNPDIGSCAAIASRIIDALKEEFKIDDESLVVGLSIGIVLYPEDEQNEQALLRKADIAMYHAKSGGGNRYQFYSESLNQNALRQLEIENLIREGLKEDLFEVYYQPKVDLKQDSLVGMEALVRLVHPEHGIIAPNEFIPLAEENGLIVEIGDLVLRKACFAAQKWREQGIFNGRVAINLSSRQFALPDLQQRISSVLQLTKLPACHLELEITESTIIKNPENAIKVMNQLAQMGVTLALDDFGTGYSSLSYLKRFPIHCLKIDKSFVDDISKSDRDLKMVDSIITIAHNMGLSVVGEGVEDDAQLNILKALKCEEIQGYIFSKPVPEVEFTKLLNINFNKQEEKQIIS